MQAWSKLNSTANASPDPQLVASFSWAIEMFSHIVCISAISCLCDRLNLFLHVLVADIDLLPFLALVYLLISIACAALAA